MQTSEKIIFQNGYSVIILFEKNKASANVIVFSVYYATGNKWDLKIKTSFEFHSIKMENFTQKF
jgi:hypothetical protein